MEFFETFQASERVIVSPAAGVYEPVEGPSQIQKGAIIGHITAAGRHLVPVRSPFSGRLVEIVAWSGERVLPRQRIAWLRMAA